MGTQDVCELVAFNQAKTAKQGELHYARLKRFSRFRKVHKLDAAQEAYHSHWYIPAVRELVVRPDFEADPKWIAKTLLPSIAPAQAKEAVDVRSFAASLPLWLLACNGTSTGNPMDAPDAGVVVPSEAGLIKSDAPRESEPRVTEAETATLGAGNRAFAFDPYRALAREEGTYSYPPTASPLRWR